MNKNYYEIEGEQYPRVTSILPRPSLEQWAVNSAIEYIKVNFSESETDAYMDLPLILEEAKTEWKNISKEALNIGSEVHELIEQYIKGFKDTEPKETKPEVLNAFNAFLEWEKENIEEWIECEKTIFHPVHCYAGTLDATAKLKNGKYYVIDFKTSTGFYGGYDLQIAAYRHAYEEEMYIQMDGMGILRLDKKTGLPEWKDYSKVYEQKKDAFIHLVNFWYADKNRRCKNKRTKK